MVSTKQTADEWFDQTLELYKSGGHAEELDALIMSRIDILTEEGRDPQLLADMMSPCNAIEMGLENPYFSKIDLNPIAKRLYPVHLKYYFDKLIERGIRADSIRAQFRALTDTVFIVLKLDELLKCGFTLDEVARKVFADRDLFETIHEGYFNNDRAFLCKLKRLAMSDAERYGIDYLHLAFDSKEGGLRGNAQFSKIVIALSDLAEAGLSNSKSSKWLIGSIWNVETYLNELDPLFEAAGYEFDWSMLWDYYVSDGLEVMGGIGSKDEYDALRRLILKVGDYSGDLSSAVSQLSYSDLIDFWEYANDSMFGASLAESAYNNSDFENAAYYLTGSNDHIYFNDKGWLVRELLARGAWDRTQEEELSNGYGRYYDLLTELLAKIS